MSDEDRGELSALVEQFRAGNPEARARLIVAIYGELRPMAGAIMRRERPDHTLQPSALVNESLLRLLSGHILVEASDRRFLFAAAAQAMRQVLVDHARNSGASKRAGRRTRVPLDAALAAFDDRGLDVVALHEALGRLAQALLRQAQVVELRFFGGLSVPEVADTLGVSDSTIEGDWRFARMSARPTRRDDE
jgi:RNA polymerase sigma factor (TIGR02999 family)